MRNSVDESEEAKFAIDCRNMRLWLSQNDGATSFDLFKKWGKGWDEKMTKMQSMGIVKCELVQKQNGGRTLAWSVVRQ